MASETEGSYGLVSRSQTALVKAVWLRESTYGRNCGTVYRGKRDLWNKLTSAAMYLD